MVSGLPANIPVPLNVRHPTSYLDHLLSALFVTYDLRYAPWQQVPTNDLVIGSELIASMCRTALGQQ